MKRPLLYVLSADLNPSILKRIEDDGFVKGFGQLSMDMIHEIHDTVAIRNFNMKQVNEA